MLFFQFCIIRFGEEILFSFQSFFFPFILTERVKNSIALAKANELYNAQQITNDLNL